ncbi:metallophosphoesterase [Parachlamydia sp. AcF125]|uniref:metallophosphoesterase n=1 Tax=Parachlamydia sp. AcF125 TaxID=2795736 RepID=UPI001BC9B840|nr:metallophosphoesterase [Parachlamydia sp. AcF125]MBS4169012.1 3',5'-cyclic adenosine monophosphate phosphodiesterase CpdA [Parachlamydia sp. AcF125]
MRIWALADLHLSFGVPDKQMDIFGERWEKWTQKIEANWRSCVAEEDLVLIPGDISWGKEIEEARPDLEWIAQLPGTKILLKGNHDYWWSSLSKLQKILPPSMHVIQNNVFHWKGIGIGGARLWDTPEYTFDAYIPYVENPATQKTADQENTEETKKIFTRELGRLEASLKGFKDSDKVRIVMTHYPPIGATLEPSAASKLLEKYRVNICVFGHLHNVNLGVSLFGEKNGIQYKLVAGDYVDFMPVKIYEDILERH